MSIDTFILYNLVMLGVGWYLLKRHGESEYREGLVDSIQMHNEGTLTYTIYTEDDGTEMININIETEEEELL